jgi:hypothetical protein
MIGHANKSATPLNTRLEPVEEFTVWSDPRIAAKKNINEPKNKPPKIIFASAAKPKIVKTVPSTAQIVWRKIVEVRMRFGRLFDERDPVRCTGRNWSRLPYNVSFNKLFYLSCNRLPVADCRPCRNGENRPKAGLSRME